MPVSQQFINQWQYSQSINRRIWDNQYVFENFNQNPVVSKLAGGASSGTAGDTNVMEFVSSAFEYNIKGTQTITAPVIASVAEGVSGLNIEMDLTANDGVEICSGIINSNPNAFKIGASSPFFFRARLTMSNPLNTDDCAIGFRKQEAYQANIDDYNDMAVLNVIAGNINIETIKSGASTVTTDTTDNFSANSTIDLQLNVDQNGAVEYLINGEAPTVTASYSFTEDLFVTPFLFFLHDSTNTNVIEFDIDFVDLNSIVATVNGVALDPVFFLTDQATTIQLLADEIATSPVVASATVTDTQEITVIFNTGSANVVDSVITTLGATQPTATITPTADAVTGLRLLEWSCGLGS
jgi:hypothetical protein